MAVNTEQLSQALQAKNMSGTSLGRHISSSFGGSFTGPQDAYSFHRS